MTTHLKNFFLVALLNPSQGCVHYIPLTSISSPMLCSCLLLSTLSICHELTPFFSTQNIYCSNPHKIKRGKFPREFIPIFWFARLGLPTRGGPSPLPMTTLHHKVRSSRKSSFHSTRKYIRQIPQLPCLPGCKEHIPDPPFCRRASLHTPRSRHSRPWYLNPQTLLLAYSRTWPLPKLRRNAPSKSSRIARYAYSIHVFQSQIQI